MLAVIIVLLFLRLFDLQIINSETYLAQSKSRISAAVTVNAPRGEIMDRNGKALVSNRLGYSVMLQKVLCTDAELNKKMLGIINRFRKYYKKE